MQLDWEFTRLLDDAIRRYQQNPYNVYKEEIKRTKASGASFRHGDKSSGTLAQEAAQDYKLGLHLVDHPNSFLHLQPLASRYQSQETAKPLVGTSKCHNHLV